MQKKSKNILVVDDSKVIVEAVKRKIESLGKFKFISAENYAECKKLSDENDFFLAVVDLELPDASNGEALEHLLRKGVSCVVLSGSVNEALRKKIVNMPIIDYIVKESMSSINYLGDLMASLDYFHGKKALIVDDSTTARKYISNAFNILMFDTVECDNPLNALEILKENKDIKIVTVDYEMPQMDGVTLIKKIKETYPEREFVIFGVTSDGSEETKYKFLKSGASSIFTKPLIKEEFNAKVSTLMKTVEQNDKLKAYLDKIDKYIITSVTDARGNITYTSEAFCQISGYTKEELIGKKHSVLRHPDMDKKVFEELWNTITSGKSWQGEIKNRTKSGDFYWVKANIEPIFDTDGSIIGYQAIRIDITDKKIIEIMSITDELTGLFNRRYFNKIIASMLESARTKKQKFAFVMADVDNFKKYNDTYGHKMGDDVLRGVGGVFTDKTRGSLEHAFRLGGEEFGVLFEVENEQEALVKADEIRNGIESLCIEHSKNTASSFVTASFGLILVDCSQKCAKNADEIYVKADEALYEAKEGGRNRVCVVNLSHL